ncbi:MAG: 2-C-methyl-D-erythritol 4-phosphate cytidylyltransferase [Verrucomicrobiales bacterium]
MISAVIVAAGKGTRMGPNVDKLFLEVAGRPIVAHTWQRFNDLPEIAEIILVVRLGMEDAFAQIARDYGFAKKFKLVHGGAERQNSVWNGIQAVDPACEIVAIQDGARPCTSPRIIRDTIDAAREIGAAVAAQKVADTLKEAGDGGLILRNVDRSRLWAVQTPQTFKVAVIRKALAEVISRNLLVTDDTAACELIGQPVKLVESKTANPKATSPADLPFIESLLRQ